MVFDPQTEAIVFKNTLRNRPQASQVGSAGILQTMRKKIVVFPKNITVAEVIEQGRWDRRQADEAEKLIACPLRSC